MAYSTFNKKKVDATLEPMFLGEGVNVSRYDVQKHAIFERLIDKQLSFFWRPEEVDLAQDKIDFARLDEHAKHIFVSNLKYQILLDSVQGRSPNMALLPLVSLPEVESWIETWAFSEVIHSRSYTHIIRTVFDHPEEVFDAIVENEEIAKRAESVTHHYDNLIEMSQVYHLHGYGTHVVDGRTVECTPRAIKRLLYLCVMATNILEGIRFYVSFACSFAFAEHNTMEGNAKVIGLIARDEQLHLTGTQHMLKLMESGEDDPEMAEVAGECGAEVAQMFRDATEEEKDWSAYLFKDGGILGMNEKILCSYSEFICNERMKAIGFLPIYPDNGNPLPWMTSYLNSDNVQVAPQETEISSYLVGAIETSVDVSKLSNESL